MSARIAAGAVGLLLLCLTGCSGASMNNPTGPTSGTRPPFTSMTPSASVPSGTPTTVPDARWDALVADLGGRGVTATPTLVSAEAMTWPNGALGCPAPGASYTQALVDGMRVVVTADGKTYDYRFGTSDTPLLCENGRPAARP
nr:hypothetical protein [Microbacterium bovistercoris]